MNFTQAVQAGLSNLFCFKGRASRSEFWWFFLFMMIFGFILQLPLFFFSFDSSLYSAYDLFTSLLISAMGIAISARRLHDIDKSGWWQLISLIPIIGIIVLIYWFCKKGTEGDNRFGADPLQTQI